MQQICRRYLGGVNSMKNMYASKEVEGEISNKMANISHTVINDITINFSGTYSYLK